jgi:hypothetical protein
MTMSSERSLGSGDHFRTKQGQSMRGASNGERIAAMNAHLTYLDAISGPDGPNDAADFDDIRGNVVRRHVVLGSAQWGPHRDAAPAISERIEGTRAVFDEYTDRAATNPADQQHKQATPPAVSERKRAYSQFVDVLKRNDCPAWRSRSNIPVHGTGRDARRVGRARSFPQ